MRLDNYLKILGFIVFYIELSPLSCYTSPFLEVVAYVLFVFSIMLYKSKFSLFQEGIQHDRIRTAILFFIAFIIPAILHFQIPFATDVLQWISILLIISLRNEYREKILSVAVKLFSVVLLVAIVEYVIGYVTGKAITIYSIHNADRSFTQSIANLYRYGNLQYRFSALANEPGALGATCGFILAFLPVKKKNIFPLIVCLIGGILSLSLAFYIYLIVILIYKIITRKIQFKYSLAIVAVLSGTVILLHNEIQSAIVLRVTESDRLDNRSSDQVNRFVTHIFDSVDGIYGVGNRKAYYLQEDSGQGNAGLKWKLFQYGIVGCGCYLLAMWLLYKKYRNKDVPYGLGILFFLMYFYAVGMWGIPLYMLLLFTTQTNEDNKQLRISKS